MVPTCSIECSEYSKERDIGSKITTLLYEMYCDDMVVARYEALLIK